MEKTKGTVVFKAIYFSLTGLIVVAITVGLIIFYNFLDDYEKNLPEKTMDVFISTLESSGFDTVTTENDFKTNDFENETALKKYYDELLKGDYTYTRISLESSDSVQVYKVKSSGNEIAKVTLKQTGGKSGFGFPIYSLSSASFGEIEAKTVTVTAPSTAMVYLNDKALDSAYITSKDTTDASLENFCGYLDNPPYNVTYTVNGFLYDPQIKAVDILGNELSLTQKDNVNVFKAASVKDDELEQFALEFSLTYSKFISNDGTKAAVISNLVSDSPMLPDIEDFENNVYAWHKGYDFTDTKVYEPIFYSEDCAAVRVTYNHVIYSTETFTFPADNTIYLTKKDGAWKVTKLIMN